MASLAVSPNLHPRPLSPISQRSPASCDTFLSPPRFTSPGPLESEHEHAPYKPGADDEVSLSMRHKKSGWKGKWSRQLKHSDHSDEGQPLLESNNLAGEASRNTWYRRDNSVGDTGLEGFNCSLIRQDSVAQYRRRLTNRQQLSQVEEDAYSSESECERQSSGDALRFAKASSIHRKRGESLVGSTAQPVASLIDAVCVSSDSYISPEQSTLRRFSFVPTQPHRNQSWTETIRSSHGNVPTLNRQDTPLSITLRKASRVFHEQRESRSMSIANRVMNWFQQSENCQPPTNFAKTRQVKFDLDIPVHDTLPVHHERLFSVAVPQSAQSSLDLLKKDDGSAYPPRRRHSVTADLALTYADMQPTHLSQSSSLSRQALVAMGTNRKPSRSSIRTGSSVHEVIWAPDDSPNRSASYNFELTKSASLSPVTDRGSIGHGSLSVPTSSVQALRAVSPTRKSATYPQAINEDVGSINESPPRHGFSSWSWQPDTIREMLKRGKDQQSDSKSAKASDARDSLQSKTKARVADTSTGLDTVESFPPLLNRKKTSDWQRLPLVDLNDPHAGREAIESSDADNEQSKVAKDKAPDLILSVLEAVASQDFANEREPGLAEIIELPHKHEADLTALKQSHSRQSLNNRHPRRASSNVGISKASRRRKPRRSISDGAIPDIATLLAQASRMVKNSMSTLPKEGEVHRRSSRDSRRRSRSVQSLSLEEETPRPVTTQDPSVRLVEVAGEDGGEGEDVGCFVTGGTGRSKSRLSLNLDWMP